MKSSVHRASPSWCRAAEHRPLGLTDVFFRYLGALPHTDGLFIHLETKHDQQLQTGGNRRDRPSSRQQTYLRWMTGRGGQAGRCVRFNHIGSRFSHAVNQCGYNKNRNSLKRPRRLLTIKSCAAYFSPSPSSLVLCLWNEKNQDSLTLQFQ